MNCPSCSSSVPLSAEACPACGFKLADLANRFGAIPRYNALLTDTTAGALTARAHRRVRKYLEYFDRRFPQMRFSAFIHPLGAAVPIREYTFYIHNTCRFTPYERNDVHGSILLFIDPNNKSACLMTGYGLEDLLSEEQLDHILMSAARDFRRDKIGDAIVTCIKETMAALKPGIKGYSHGKEPAPLPQQNTLPAEAAS